MRYYIYYDKNGAFLGGLAHKRKPSNKNCTEVSEAEYKNILALNGITIKEETTVDETTAEDTADETTTDETTEEVV